ncbi:DUF1800 domain-containing protein [Limnohabitans sp.]|uniref:DUF1800 domain-containing protein n=1 Tax=Limnohabitans sp. TaxID=1907725 RepID=UPI0025B9EF4F|nr:DUF1800 domain-containing protein [Limnohabitans sp.]
MAAHTLKSTPLAAGGMLLAACGGGGGSSGSGSGTSPGPAPTDAEAARFLGQAGFSASAELIAAVKTSGFANWLDSQLALPVQDVSRYDWMVANGYAVDANRTNFTGADNAIWLKLMSSPDPVRQRMTLALSEIFVVSMQGLPIEWRGLCIAHYADLLEKNAFGTYRQLLQDVTLSVGMGSYLNMLGNRKEDTRTGRVPDENYAREVMQLFSIGLVQLGSDGAPRLSNGQPVDSYSPQDISQLASVFTGWERDRVDATDYAHVTRPMKHNAANFQSGDKSVLGTAITGSLSGPQALTLALDTLANHPNVGPFIGRQLIQRFTMSHPSPAYVGRVAAVFNNNGRGVRGDLKATLRAVLLDPEARAIPSGNASGRLREPVQRFVQWGRTFGVTSTSGRWPIGDTSDPGNRLGQSPWRSPSVFNFFRPGYVPPGHELAANQITAPEFQLVNESTVAGYLNFMQSVIGNGISSGDVSANYAHELSLALDPPKLLAHLNLRLAADAIHPTTLTELSTAVATISASTATGQLNRVKAAILLVMAAPEYLIQK